ncbi:hypothetical protein WJX84_010492 [Apatococcus fuscideae]|uniref:Uncharacterized protein n=1 Tax=Apatococcus fuscideae TaxID=2026836 RepID=A0AAW1RKF5_9CHLO
MKRVLSSASAPPQRTPVWRCFHLTTWSRQQLCPSQRLPFGLEPKDPAISCYVTHKEQHALLETRSGSLYLTALKGDPESITSQSFTWLNGSPLRPGVAYLLGTGAELEFGSTGSPCRVEFQQKDQENPMLGMLMKSMATNEEVRKQLEQN